MAETIPQDVFDKLEREWRLMDPDRVKPNPKPAPQDSVKRLKVGRID